MLESEVKHNITNDFVLGKTKSFGNIGEKILLHHLLYKYLCEIKFIPFGCL